MARLPSRFTRGPTFLSECPGHNDDRLSAALFTEISAPASRPGEGRRCKAKTLSGSLSPPE